MLTFGFLFQPQGKSHSAALRADSETVQPEKFTSSKKLLEALELTYAAFALPLRAGVLYSVFFFNPNACT